MNSVMNKDQKYFFDEAIKQNYSIQIHNKTIEYFNNLIQIKHLKQKHIFYI